MAQYVLDQDRQLKTPAASERLRRLAGSASTSRISTNSPGARIVPVVSRSDSDRERQPDQLSLDGRDLLACPVLENEDQLKMLSLQNNYIRCIERIALQNLVFLDFFNNNLQTLSGLDSVPNLRVLLLGKNNLRSIQNLYPLTLLVVLDLHANNINRIENIQHLKMLRILNLKHNRIERVSKISGLNELVEINLSHNQVAHISPIRGLPNLQRMFLSHNRIDSVTAIEEISTVRSLIELTLKWNPITADLQLMENLVSSLTTLSAFDLWRDGIRPDASQTDIWPEVQCDQGLPLPDSDLKEGAETPDKVAAFQEAKVAPWSVTLQKIQQWWERVQHQAADAMDGNAVPSYYKLEEGRTKLVVFGFGFQALELEQSAACVSVSFNYAPFSSIVPFFTKLITWPNLKRLEFHHNAIDSLRQFDALAIFMRIEEVVVSGNPIIQIDIHRKYLLFTMKNLKRYNEEVITDDDVLDAKFRFSRRWPKYSRTAMRTKTFLAASAQVNPRGILPSEDQQPTITNMLRNRAMRTKGRPQIASGSDFADPFRFQRSKVAMNNSLSRSVSGGVITDLQQVPGLGPGLARNHVRIYRLVSTETLKRRRLNSGLTNL